MTMVHRVMSAGVMEEEVSRIASLVSLSRMISM